MVIPVERVTAAMYVFQFSVISLLFLIFQIPYVAAVVAHEKMEFYAVVSIIDALFKLLIAIGLQYISYDRLVYYGLLMLMISLANIIYIMFMLRENLRKSYTIIILQTAI